MAKTAKEPAPFRRGPFSELPERPRRARPAGMRSQPTASTASPFRNGEPLATEEGAAAFIRYLADALDPSELEDFVAELERRRDHDQGFPSPPLLVYAREDPMVPPEIGPKLHRLVPEAEFRWLENTSHFAHVDSPAPLRS